MSNIYEAASNFKISPHLYSLMASGIKATGSFNPDECMTFFAESLTGLEYDRLYPFLKWVHQNRKTFGHGNYGQVYQEFVSSLK